MTELRDVQALLVDMDGTLVDSGAAVERLWREWAQGNGVDPDAVVAVCHGAASDTTIRRFRPDLDEATIAAEAAAHMQRETQDVEGVVAADGADEFVSALADLGLPWAVVTNADRALATARLGAAGVHPPLVIAVDEVERGKPDPASYLLGARRLDVPIAACLVVEDSPTGVAAGRAAGAHVAGLADVDADLAVDGLGDLAARLRDARA